MLNANRKFNHITMYVFLIIAISSCVVLPISSDDEISKITINTEQGTLEGRHETGITGNKYYCFKGIPYAKPPLGTLRFKAPQPPDSWNGVRNATVHRGICFQQAINLEDPAENESEDCLYLNVYTLENPNNATNKLKPVMFWIHGGAFVTGSGNSEMYGPDYLIQEDIIVVTINYRLGIFGFLRVDDPISEIPGNAGLKDMVMALKWTKDNIINFGGDPNNITISGQSAGAASTHLLTLTPLATGLFKRAIIESGAALAMWSLISPEIKPVFEIAAALNITNNNESQIVEELYKLSANDLIGVQNRINNSAGYPPIFAPTIEKSSNETAFISDHPLNIIRSGNYSKVPVIFGYVSREGMLLIKNGLGFLKRDTEELIPFDWEIRRGSSKSNELTEKIAKFYYKGEKPNEDNIDITYTVLSDTFFINPIYQSMREQMKVSDEKIYLFRFSVDGRNNFAKKKYDITLPGVCHGDNNFYQFARENYTPDVIPNSLEDLTMKRFAKLIANFVKYEDPTFGEESNLINIKWDPISEDGFVFLELGENLSVGLNPDIHRQHFWDELRQSLNNSSFYNIE